MKVFITDLEAYNNGHLVGNWYTLPMNEDLLAESIKDVLRAGRQACEHEHFHEEIFITDYECEYMSIGEYDNITKLNETAEAMQDIDEDGIKAINFLMKNNFVKDIYEAIESYEDSVRIHENCSMKDIAENYIEECYNLDDIPDIISRNIDYDSIAYDMEIEGNYYIVDGDIYEYIN
jgi:hypothetical protein